MTKGLSEKERKQNKEYYKKRDATWKPSEKDRENPNNKHLLPKEPKDWKQFMADISANQLDGLKSWKVIKNHKSHKKSRKIKNDSDEKNKTACECGGKHRKEKYSYQVNDFLWHIGSYCSKCGEFSSMWEEDKLSQQWTEEKEEESKRTYEEGVKPERKKESGDYGLGSVTSKKILKKHGVSHSRDKSLKTEKVQFDPMVQGARELIAVWTNSKRYSKNFLVEETLTTFKQARHLLYGRTLEPFTAACFYFVCRKNKIPITAGSIFEGYCKEKNVTDIFHLICNHLGEKLPLDKAEDKIRYVGKKVFMPEVLLRKASELIDRIPDSESGRSPTGIAAAALFLVSKDSEYAVTQKKLAEAVGIHKLTIGKSVKIVEKYWKNIK